MKKFLAILIAVVIMLSAAPIQVVYAADYQDNPLDQMGDWVATMGKQGMEKDRILAERKADRLKRHAEREAKKLQKEAEKSGADMKKKLGF